MEEIGFPKFVEASFVKQDGQKPQVKIVPNAHTHKHTDTLPPTLLCSTALGFQNNKSPIPEPTALPDRRLLR